MHSFPAHYTWNLTPRRNPGPEASTEWPAVLLFERPNESYAVDLGRALRIPRMQGRHAVNALIYWATVRGIDSVLFEANESAVHERDVRRLLQQLVRWLRQNY